MRAVRSLRGTRVFHLFDLMKHHGDAATGVVLGGTTSSLIASTPPAPELWVEAARWVGAAFLSLLPIVVTRAIAYREARARALAEAKEREARQLEDDKDPKNDKRAQQLREQALEHRAEAAGLAAARDTRGKGRSE